MHTSAIKIQATKFVQPHLKNYCLIIGPIIKRIFNLLGKYFPDTCMLEFRNIKCKQGSVHIKTN